jgi:hypothetical protein
VKPEETPEDGTAAAGIGDLVVDAGGEVGQGPLTRTGSRPRPEENRRNPRWLLTRAARHPIRLFHPRVRRLPRGCRGLRSADGSAADGIDKLWTINEPWG